MWIQNAIVTSLILQFDGSLRNPSTLRPNESVRPRHLLSPSSPMASCAAALLQEDGRTVHSLGGKPLSTTHHTITSADAEYEGLLLGLNHILYLCENSLLPHSDRNGDSNDDAVEDGGIDVSDESTTTTIRILVQGDCKTVVDHLNRRAVPRRQRGFYDEARGLIDRIQSVTAAEGRYPVTFRFRHIPREENSLCDLLCRMVIDVIQKKAMTDVRRKTKELVEASARDAYAGDNRNTIKLPTSKKKRLMLDKTPFAVPLGYLSNDGGSYVPLYLRPALVCDIACAAISVHDPVAVRLCGHTIIQEANLWQRLYKKELTGACDLDNLGRLLDYMALFHMQLYREADEIWRRLDVGVDRVERGDDMYLLCTRVVDELRRVQSLVHSRDDVCVNFSETILPYSDWDIIVNNWYQLLIDTFVEPKNSLPKNGRKKLMLENSVWLL